MVAQPSIAAEASRVEAGSLTTACAAASGHTGWSLVGGPIAGSSSVVGLVVREAAGRGPFMGAGLLRGDKFLITFDLLY